VLNLLDNYLRKTNLLPEKSKLVVAVSGGVDSVVLLDLLSKLQASYGWQILVAHLDHKIRPNSADDALLVANLSNKYGHQFYLGQLDGKKKDEASLRQSRYRFLDSILTSTNSDLIVTAHHSDDRLETSLINIIRGADRKGLNSLKARRGNIVRPLLNFTKGQIIVYANLNNLTYCEDITNSDLNYSRNLIRHQVLPLGSVWQENFRSNYLDSLNQIEELNQRIDWLLEQVSQAISTDSQRKITVNLESFSKLSPEVQINLLAYLIKKLHPSVNLSLAVLNRAREFVLSDKLADKSDLISNLKISKNYGIFMINLAREKKTASPVSTVKVLSFNNPVKFSNFVISLSRNLIVSEADYCLVKPTSLYVRNWQPGDKIYPVGMKGSKKIQDIFVDNKIPYGQRKKWPVVVNAVNQLVWLPTLAKDRRFLASPSEVNYRIICQQVK